MIRLDLCFPGITCLLSQGCHLGFFLGLRICQLNAAFMAFNCTLSFDTSIFNLSAKLFSIASLSLAFSAYKSRHVNINLIFSIYDLPEALLSLPSNFLPVWLLPHLFLPEVLLSPSATSFLLPLYQSPFAER